MKATALGTGSLTLEIWVSHYYLLHAAVHLCAVPFRHNGNSRPPGKESDLRCQCAKPDCHRPAADHKFECRRPLWQPSVENGFQETGNGGHRSFDLLETAVRFGIASKTELRFTTPDYFFNDDTASGFANGFGDLSVGFKQQLGPTRDGFDVSLIPSVSFPTGANLISSHGYDPTVQLPWSRLLTKNWTAAGMFSLMWPTEGALRNLTGQSSVYFDRQLTPSWDAYVEYSGAFPQRGGLQHVIDFGTAYKPSPHQQLDFHCGFSLSAATPDHSIGVGYSVRFQVIRSR
jgi:hypothetical protein